MKSCFIKLNKVELREAIKCAQMYCPDLRFKLRQTVCLSISPAICA